MAKKTKFVRSFFGRIYGTQICLRFYLTFSIVANPLERKLVKHTSVQCYQPRIIWPGFIGKFCEIFEVFIATCILRIYSQHRMPTSLGRVLCTCIYNLYIYQIPVLYNVKFYTWFIFNTNSSTRFCKVERFGNSSSARLVSRAQLGQNLFEMAFIWKFQNAMIHRIKILPKLR